MCLYSYHYHLLDGTIFLLPSSSSHLLKLYPGSKANSSYSYIKIFTNYSLHYLPLLQYIVLNHAGERQRVTEVLDNLMGIKKSFYSLRCRHIHTRVCTKHQGIHVPLKFVQLRISVFNSMFPGHPHFSLGAVLTKAQCYTKLEWAWREASEA